MTIEKRFAVVFAVLLSVGYAFGQQNSDTISVSPRYSDMFVLTPAAPATSRTIVIDHAQRADILVSALVTNLSVTLVSPRHDRYQFGQSRGAFQSVITTDPLGGANYSAVILNPVPGTWTLEISERKLASTIGVAVNAFFDSQVIVAMVPGAGEYRTGDTAMVSIAAFDGTTPLPALQISASIVAPDQSSSAITFADDGTHGDIAGNDGVYTASVPLTQTGQYAITADVQGIADGVPFRRTAATVVRTQNPTAAFEGTFTDHGVDTNGDGVTDEIVVAPVVIVNDPGTYAVSVRLSTASGKILQKRQTLALGSGRATPAVAFMADAIRSDLAEDGPYQVSLMILERQDGNQFTFNDRLLNAGATGAYSLSGLQRPHLRITGPLTSTPLDLNGNGLFDALKVAVQLETDVAGAYSCSAGLSANDGTSLGDASIEQTLSAGVNTVSLTFDGGPIGKHLVDGPYRVHLSVFGPSPSLSGDANFQTTALVASTFEGFIPDTTPPSLSVTVTPQTLWPVDHRMIQITPSITVSDDRDPAPIVHLDAITSDEGANWLGDGNTSPDILVQDNTIYLRAERSGPDHDRHYILSWSARDHSGNTTRAAAMVIVPHDQQ